jgi:pimeloyl-ACP methyl ester carboxylesterase
LKSTGRTLFSAVIDFVRRRRVRLSVGAGLLGLVVLTARFALRPPKRTALPPAVFPAIFATRILPTRHGQLVYHESGQGEPLIFVHGIYPGASSYEWSRVYPHFADRYHVLAPDLLGFAESARPDLTLSADEHAELIADLLRAKCGGRRATIVASGLGAAFVARAAERFPELVLRVIFFMPLGLDTGAQRRAYQRGRWLSFFPWVYRSLYRRYLVSRPRIEAWLTTFGFGPGRLLDAETVQVLVHLAQQFGAERAQLQLLRNHFRVDLHSVFTALQQPVTLLWSDSAVVPSLAEGYKLQALPRQCTFRLLHGVGALGPLEDPAQMKTVLDDELDTTLRVYQAL